MCNLYSSDKRNIICNDGGVQWIIWLQRKPLPEWKVSDRRVLPLAAFGADGWNLPLQIPKYDRSNSNKFLSGFITLIPAILLGSPLDSLHISKEIVFPCNDAFQNSGTIPKFSSISKSQRDTDAHNTQGRLFPEAFSTMQATLPVQEDSNTIKADKLWFTHFFLGSASNVSGSILYSFLTVFPIEKYGSLRYSSLSMLYPLFFYKRKLHYGYFKRPYHNLFIPCSSSFATQTLQHFPIPFP